MGRKFTMIDEGFECIICKKLINPLQYTARDHCCSCLSSLHVDIYPGDRENECRGVLKAIGIERHKKGYKIIYRCTKCGEIKKNIAADDDNMKLIIELSTRPV